MGVLNGSDLRSLDRSIKGDYSSSEDNLLDDFYVPLLGHSTIYKRAAGFFSSGLIALRPIAFADFVERNGSIDLICCPRIQQSDLEAFLSRPSDISVARSRVIEDLRSLSSQDDKWYSLTVALTSMIHAGVLNLRVLVPNLSSDISIFHDKMGLMSDGFNWVSFLGSANESASAWLPDRNHEVLDVFKSWEDRDRERIDRHRYLFERLWGGPRGWKVVRQKEFVTDLFEIAAPTDLSSAFERVRYETEEWDFVRPGPRPLQRSSRQTPLRPYQLEVVKNWEEHDHKGIVKFATGGGKSLVAIEIIRRWMREGGSALLLVPTSILHNQWLDDLMVEMSGVPVTAVGNGYPVIGREMLIRTALQRSVVISTYKTAATERFMRLIDEPDRLLVVADEVHNAGQPTFIRFLSSVKSGARLGLSATPNRFGDQEGTEAIYSYFGADLKPAFTLEDAITAGVLVHYQYDYESVSLTFDEQNRYDQLTDRIRQMLHLTEEGSGTLSEALRYLLIKRARIVKNAEGKASLAARIVEKNWEFGDRWLIYCSDQYQLFAVKRKLQNLGLDQVIEYHQNMEGSREDTIRFFGDRTGILLAIKCLDEGVNIPSVNKAVILASSTNPREYIQRRGRLLRTAPNKTKAHIWDCMVRDSGGRIISQGELIRGIEFARSSDSPATLLNCQREARESGYDIVEFEDEDDESTIELSEEA